MAEPPRYQPTGYQPADVPRLDFANLKESVAMTQGISSALDRLSNFAFKEADERAEREGLRFGAENRPNAEQVMAALQAGKSPEELFAEPGTTFGNAARKVQAAQLRNELEVKIRNEFANISGLVESGSFDLTDVQGRIKAATDGYSRAISSVSPEEGLKFRASAGSAGAPVYAKAAERAYKIYGETQKANADDLISQTPIIIADLMRVEKDPVVLAERIGIERQRVFDIAKQTNDPQFFNEKRADFDRALMGAIVDYTISPEFAKNPVDGLRKMQAGDFGQLDRVMLRVNKDKLLKMYVDRTGEVAKAWKSTSELNASVNEDKMNEIEDQFSAGKISAQQVLNQAKVLGITLSDERRKALIGGEGAGANAMLYGQLESLAERKVVGENYFDNLATNKIISWKQANVLKKEVRNDSPEMTKGKQFIEFTLGINDPMSSGLGNARQVSAEAKAELVRKQEAARAAGEPFNPFEAANEITKTEKVQQEVQKQIDKKTRLTKKFETNKLVYDSNRIYTADDLIKAGVNKSEAESIIRIQNGK